MTRLIKRAFALLLVLSVAATGVAAWGVHRYRSEPVVSSSAPVRVMVPKGASLRGIASELQRRGIDVSERWLQLAGRLRGDTDRIKSGLYELAPGTTLQALLDKMVAGNVLMTDIRFTEGWTFRQMRAAIDRHPDLAHDTASLDEKALLSRIGATETNAEGLFFPDTYLFTPGSSDLDVYRGAYRRMKRTLEDAWNSRRPDVPLRSQYELLVLASIVEKETGSPADRDKVAAVFVNRLRRGMMLQSDPTTIYGLGERFDGNLRRADLRADTPYNTYTRGGLPPTPISLPGKTAIAATVNPARIDALYFVARGDGTSEFSDDLSAHNRAVARYQLKQR